MQSPPHPANEIERLEALCELEILDTEPEERFDRLTRLARKLFDVPMAIISLVDAERQWFKSRQGLEPTETPRAISFCGHAILSDSIFCIPDALQDQRFVDNPLVTGPPGLRFYAGAPLAARDGSRVGTLCILDTRPREFGEEQAAALRDLANCVEEELKQSRLRDAMRDLAEQRSYLRNILESVSEGIIAIDQGGVIRSFNSAAQRMFGYRENEIIGRKFTCLMTETDAGQLAEHLHFHVSDDDGPTISSRQEVEALRKDGSAFPAGLTIGKTDMGGELMFSGVVRNIADRKNLERMKDEFISTVSHELRTPLTSIMGSLGLVKGGAFGQLSEDVLEMLNIAYTSCDRLIRLVNDMLDLERIEAGRSVLRSVPVDLNTLAETAISEIAGYCSAFEVEVDFQPIEAPAMVLGDPEQLLRVITNLLSNAIKHSPSGGKVQVGVVTGDATVTVTVTDEGPGIPEVLQPHLFERFTQADASDSRTKPGVGLGLSIAKAIIDQHAGSIDFETQPDRGTTFRFDLPRHRATLSGQKSPDGEIGRVLICEDDPEIANLLSLIMRRAGIATELAATISDARSLLAAKPFDALTLDLCLPDGDGLDLIQDLRARPETAKLPIVVVSANVGSRPDQLDGAALGVIDWIPKPLDLDRVMSSVGQAVRQTPVGLPSVLHVESKAVMGKRLARLLKHEVDLVSAADSSVARNLLQARDFDLVILDLASDEESGEALIGHLQSADGAPIPAIVYSSEPPSVELASRVSAALCNARFSKERLAATILALLEKAPEPLSNTG